MHLDAEKDEGVYKDRMENVMTVFCFFSIQAHSLMYKSTEAQCKHCARHFLSKFTDKSGDRRASGVVYYIQSHV